jgi:hypothetical protein
MQGMMRAIGDAAPERGARLDHDEAERPFDPGKASDGSRRAGESAADHAHRQWRLPHLAPFKFDSRSPTCLRQIKAQNKDEDMTRSAKRCSRARIFGLSKRISFRAESYWREEILLPAPPAGAADLFRARKIDDEAMTHTRS